MNYLNKKRKYNQVNTGFIAVLVCFLSLSFSISCSSDVEDKTDFITIGTFNIAWLGDGIDDTNPRSEKDYNNIADIIINSGADIIGLEEIENDDALRKLTKYLDDYSFFVGNESGSQNPAILYKSSLQLKQLKYIYELEVEPNKTKPGLLFEVKKGNFDWLMMVVHFKSTSRYDSTDELEEQSRILRSQQAEALSSWIDSTLGISTEKDLIIVGDFNDYPARKTNPTLISLVENKNIEFLTSEMKSCKYEYLYSIDHILVSKSAKQRYLSNSIRMYNFFNALTSLEAEKISDHCPVLATFNISKHDND
ncbi:MAG: endonuclease/exonuclease/phosphatase family protein [bacterium]